MTPLFKLDGLPGVPKEDIAEPKPLYENVNDYLEKQLAEARHKPWKLEKKVRTSKHWSKRG